MKSEIRVQVISDRKTGLSVRELSKKYSVSKSSVSRWVQGIVLPNEQSSRLYQNRIVASVMNREKLVDEYRKQRHQYQLDGRLAAQQGNWLHLAGSMLYWAEGSKSRNSLRLGNTDVHLLKLYMRFIRECLNVRQDQISVTAVAYTNNGKTGEQIAEYWKEQLKVGAVKLRLDRFPKSHKGTKKIRHLYGLAEVSVYDTRLAQNVFGAIQEYGSFSRQEWLG